MPRKENNHPVYSPIMSADEYHQKRKPPVLPCEYAYRDRWIFGVTHMWEELWHLLSPGKMLPMQFVMTFCNMAAPEATLEQFWTFMDEAVEREYLRIAEFQREDGKEHFVCRADVLLPGEYSLDYALMGS